MRPSFALRAFVVLVCVLTGLPLAAKAQVQRFPYEATIGGDDVFLRSGPGKKYYPTGRLKTADRVIVHRHDPGGWYMITPPAGSFSWIQADMVKPLGNRRGLVTATNVPVHVGSAIGESADVEQLKLSTNEQVQLLDDAPVDGPGGRKSYRIVPPQGEYRWILGQFVAPVDAGLRKQHDRDPFSTPSTARPVSSKPAADVLPRGSRIGNAPPEVDDTAAGFGGAARPAPTPTTASAFPMPSGTPVGAAPGAPPTAADFPANDAPVTQEADQFKRERQQLIDIDGALRRTLEADISTWNLDGLESAYAQLAKTATNPTIARQIEPRMKTIAQHRQLKAEYDEFIRLTSETTRRDNELAALQSGGNVASATPGGLVPIPATAQNQPGFPAPQSVATSGPPAAPTGQVGPSLISGEPVGEPPAPVASQDLASGTPTSPETPVNAFADSVLFGPPENRAVPSIGPMTVGSAAPTNSTDPFEAPVVRSPDALSASPAGIPVTAPLAVTTVTPPGGPAPRGYLPQSQVPVMANRPVPNQPFAGQFVPSQNAAGMAAPTQQPLPRAVHGFSGAGIVQKMRPLGPGMPQHVLVAPGGRVLAFLQPGANVNLDQHIGQPIGVTGPRVRRADLRGDLISVDDVSPVRLAPR